MSPLVGAHNAPGGIWNGEVWEQDMQGGGLVHQWLLGGWGVMIGEMWDLERLCDKAEKLGRATCFVSSVPLKVSRPILRDAWQRRILMLDRSPGAWRVRQTLWLSSKQCLGSTEFSRLDRSLDYNSDPPLHDGEFHEAFYTECLPVYPFGTTLSSQHTPPLFEHFYKVSLI
jgi:hypothetical protein